ncbi:MAG: GGDEF domain-containing protein [Lachnospiraceae bacterium]|nr:GGDEF domain-containing protein [Lachnospiraceae bacterium]
MEREKTTKKRLNIALCIGMLESEFSHAICEGALMAAKDMDANLFILPGGILDLGDNRPNDERNLRYHYQYNTLYSYVDNPSFDAVIVEYGVITSLLEENKKKDFLKNFGDSPVILLAGTEEGYQSITIDNKPGIHDAVKHLVQEHGCHKIGFVSGPKTNQDAIERLEAFREAVQMYGSDDSEELIAYGDFTEYYPEVTEQLIKNNPDIEAIVYANDQMAVSGYQAARKLGLEPGKNIRITGFDDSPFAMMMEPYMTSVRVDIKEIGYRAVKSCPDLIQGKDITTRVPSKLVIRESCGCNNANIVKNMSDKMIKMEREEAVLFFVNDIMEKYVSSIYDIEEKKRVWGIMERYFNFCFGMIQDNVIKCDDEAFKKEYKLFEEVYIKGYINLEVLFLINQIMYGYMSSLASDDKSCRWLLEQISFSSNSAANTDDKKKLESNERSKVFESFLTNITGDILQQENFSDEAHRFESLVNKLQRMSYKSSYIYVYVEKYGYNGDRRWKMPEKCYIRAGHDGDDIFVYDEYEKYLDCVDIFSRENLPTSHRFDFLVLPLFSNNLQFGITLMEVEIESFRFAQQIACQISVTLEVLDIMREQNQIKRELEINLAKSVETNKLLDEMSRMDPMTGVTNRRGFFHIVNEMLRNKANIGKKAVAVYADMDCLKVINDEFGHDDGDFSLKTIATTLNESFRKNDVVGRMGGDEFAAFAMINQDNYGEVLKRRIQDSLREFNEHCDKPYYINMSVGYYEFIISEETDIEEILRLADENLYEEKKNKVKHVYKNKD